VTRAGAESRRSFALLLAVLVTLGAGLALHFTGAAGRLELDAVDARFQLRAPVTPPEVALVAIDDVTFDDLELQWPFPRSLHARMVDALTAAGARTIVYDIQFTERTKLDEDLALYDALDRSRRVVLATTEVDEEGRTNVMGGDQNLRAAGARAGAAHMPTDPADVIRRFPHAMSGLESLAVAGAERASGREIAASAFPAEGAWIDYAGPPGTVPTYSFSRVLDGAFPDDAFRGKIVVVGATSPSLQDIHPTPVSGNDPMSGPEVQANAVATALHGLPLRSAPGWAGLLAVLGASALAPLLAWRLRLVPALTFAVLAGAAYALASVLAFDRGTVLVVAVPLLTLATGLLATIVAQYLGETRARRFYARYSRALEDQVAARTEELRTAQREILERLGQAVELREVETGRHVERVSRLAEALALEVGIPARDAEILRLGAALHDIGKIGIPDSVLLKVGSLDDEEWALMRGHTTIGARILSGSASPLVRVAETIALTHHEWWDGSGYPEGVAGQAIPIEGRITAIADVFDALVSSRSYKAAWSLTSAVDEIRQHAGTQFDPALVEAFARIVPRLYEELGYGAPEAAPVEAVPPAR